MFFFRSEEKGRKNTNRCTSRGARPKMCHGQDLAGPLGPGQGGGPRRQTAYKPGSVPVTPRPAWRGMTIHLGRPLPDASRDPPGRTARKHAYPVQRGAPPLLGLAPGGVCPAAGVAASAVRSYRTLSPLPAGSDRILVLAEPVRAVSFLWHFPWGCPRRVLPGTVFPWSPDFPPLGRSGKPARRKAAIRPSGQHLGKHGLASGQAAEAAS